MAPRVLVIAWVFAAAVIAQVPAQERYSPPPPGGQSPAEPQQQPPTFRTGTELVRVDVSVVDRSGQPVTLLSADDFEVEEDGVPQEIQSFKLVEADGQPVPGDDTSLTIRSPSHAAAEAAKDDVRVFLIFWDEYHVGEMLAGRTREHLTRFVRTAFGPTDLVGFMDPLTTLDSIRFTRDRWELTETVRTLRGRRGVYTPTRSVIEEAHLRYARSVEQVRSQVTVSALKAAAVHLGAIREGRKAIIFISEGLPALGRDALPMMSDLIRAANDANTAIYVIDPRGLMVSGRPSGLLAALANETGGEHFATNDLQLAFRRVIDQASAFYLLGYAPLMKFDGRFHQIRVRVKRPGMQVRARAGYWAPTAGDMVRASEAAAKATLPPVMEEAFAALAPASAHRAVDVWIGTALKASGRPEVQVTWSLREPQTDDIDLRPADVTVVATSGDLTVFEGAAGADGVVFEAAPGTLQMAITVRNEAGETIDRDQRTLLVPDPAAPLWISSPAVFRTRNAREVRALNGESPVPPHAGRDFTRGDRLFVRFAVCGASADGADVTARLINRHGDPLTNLTLTPPSADGQGRELDLPLGSIARGDYLIEIAATRGDLRAETFVPLRILK